MSRAGHEGLRSIRLENLPVGHLLQLDRHLSDLLHELQLIGSGMASGILDVEVPRRLANLIEELNERFASERLISRQVIEEADARGDETVTLELVLPVEAAPAVEQYRELLEQVDEYCRSGALLTLALPPELVAVRRRVFDEVLSQLRRQS